MGKEGKEVKFKMPLSAKMTEDKVHQIETAWSNLAPERSFGGLSLEQYRAAIKPSVDTRAHIGALEDQLRAEYSRRDAADQAATLAVARIVNGVRADPELGDNSALYEAMGYVRRSARRTGGRRPRKPVTAIAA